MSRFLIGSGKFSSDVSGYSVQKVNPAQKDSPFGTASGNQEIVEPEVKPVVIVQPANPTVIKPTPGAPNTSNKEVPETPENVIPETPSVMAGKDSILGFVEKNFGKYWYVWIIIIVLLLTRKK